MEWPDDYRHIVEENRKQAFEKYDVQAIFRSKLLPGQEKNGYHGQPVETYYYVFTFHDRSDPLKKGSFICGDHAADGWFKLTKQPKEEIPSYNPLSAAVGAGAGAVAGAGAAQNGGAANANNPQMVRLINCLQSYISLLDNTLNASGQESTATIVLKRLLEDIEQAPTISQVRAVNTLFFKTFNNNFYINNGVNNYSTFVDYIERKYSTPTDPVKIKRIVTTDLIAILNNEPNYKSGIPYPYNISF